MWVYNIRTYGTTSRSICLALRAPCMHLACEIGCDDFEALAGAGPADAIGSDADDFDGTTSIVAGWPCRRLKFRNFQVAFFSRLVDYAVPIVSLLYCSYQQ